MYAEVASEKAIKGQGGNRYINIELTYGSGEMPIPFSSLLFLREVDDYVLYIDGKEVKRQKGKRYH